MANDLLKNLTITFSYKIIKKYIVGYMTEQIPLIILGSARGESDTRFYLNIVFNGTDKKINLTQQKLDEVKMFIDNIKLITFQKNQ